MTAGKRRRGRRPGKADTRQEILSAARQAFADGGYDGTTTRQIAAAAGVDVALIHHYFGTKDKLFVAAVEFPLDPADVIDGITTGSLDELGERLVDAFLTAWDDPTSGSALQAVLRGATTHKLARRLVQEFFAVHISRRVGARLEGVIDPSELMTRASLAASQLLGLALVRYILRFEPLASLPRQTVVAAVGPTVQRYLTGSIDHEGRDPTVPSRDENPDR